MSKATGKTFVRIPLKEARILKELLQGEFGDTPTMKLIRMHVEAVLSKALEKAEKREAKKQEIADEMGA